MSLRRPRVSLERLASTGRIRVFFDDMDTPILEVVDQTIGAGRVGFGSFDDTGRFSSIVVEGVVEGVVDGAVGEAGAPIGTDKTPPVAPPMDGGVVPTRAAAEPGQAPAPRAVSPQNPFGG